MLALLWLVCQWVVGSLRPPTLVYEVAAYVTLALPVAAIGSGAFVMWKHAVKRRNHPVLSGAGAAGRTFNNSTAGQLLQAGGSHALGAGRQYTGTPIPNAQQQRTARAAGLGRLLGFRFQYGPTYHAPSRHLAGIRGGIMFRIFMWSLLLSVALTPLCLAFMMTNISQAMGWSDVTGQTGVITAPGLSGSYTTSFVVALIGADYGLLLSSEKYCVHVDSLCFVFRNGAVGVCYFAILVPVFRFP